MRRLHLCSLKESQSSKKCSVSSIPSGPDEELSSKRCNYLIIFVRSRIFDKFILLLIQSTYNMLNNFVFYCFNHLVNKSKGLESSQNFKTDCVKCYCLILSTEQIEGIFRSFAIIPIIVHFTLSLFSELQLFLCLMNGEPHSTRTLKLRLSHGLELPLFLSLH